MWKLAKDLRPGGPAVEVKLTEERTANALRCALRRAKNRGRVPEDILVRAAGVGAAHLVR